MMTENTQAEEVLNTSSSAWKLADDSPYKYALESSTWDTLLFTGGIETMPGETAMLLFMAVFTIVIQGLFCSFVSNTMIAPHITTDVLDALATWRAVVGHKV